MREVGGRRKVRDRHHGVGGCLDEEQPGLGPDGALHGVEVGGVDVAERDLAALQHPVEQPEGAAIRVLGHDDVVAGRQLAGDRGDGGHAGRERTGCTAALDGCQIAFERAARRILRPRVLETLVPAELRLHVGRGLVNRCDDGAGRGVGLLPGVDADRAESSAAGQFHACLVRKSPMGHSPAASLLSDMILGQSRRAVPPCLPECRLAFRPTIRPTPIPCGTSCSARCPVVRSWQAGRSGCLRRWFSSQSADPPRSTQSGRSGPSRSSRRSGTSRGGSSPERSVSCYGASAAS